MGGIGGFYEFLEALADPKHEQHDDFMEWGDEFDPEKFDAQQATKDMDSFYWLIGNINSVFAIQTAK